MGRTSDFLIDSLAGGVPLDSAAQAVPNGCHPGTNSTAVSGLRIPENESSGRAACARIFLMQDHPLMILGTSNLLNGQSDLEVNGSAKTPAEALSILENDRPDLVIFELSVTGPFSFSHLVKLHRRHPSVPVLAFSCHEEAIFARRALEAGASGYLMKDEPPGKLIEAIHAILRGETYVSERCRRLIRERNTAARSAGSIIDSLNNRELHILQLLGDGYSRDRIQNELNLTPGALNSAFYKMRRKLGLVSTAELMQLSFHWAYYEGDFA